MAIEAQRDADFLKQMKLVVFSHKPCWRSPSSESGYATDGGFPFQVRALSEIFAATSLVVPVYSRGPAEGESPLLGAGLRVRPLTPLGGRGLRRKIAFIPWALRNSLVILRQTWMADAVHAPVPGDVGTVGMLCGLLSRKPLFVRHCGNWFVQRTPAERFWRWFMERFAGGRNVMLATGGGPHPPSARNGNVQWIFSTSLAELELRELAKRAPGRHGSQRLITVCRQEPGKGTDVVIRSLPLILGKYRDVCLDVVGDGSLLERWRRLAADLGVGQSVVFHGKVGHPRVVELLRQASVFCFPTSASDGFPKVVLEAMACGLHVLATPVSVLRELLEGGGGMVVEERTPEHLANLVCACLSDEAGWERMSRRASQTAQGYSLERWRDAVADKLRAAWEPRTVRV